MNTGRQRSSLTPFGAETETTSGGNLHFNDFGLDYADNVDVLEEYLNMQGRFKNLSVDDKRIIRQHIEGRLEFIQRQEGLK